MRSSRKLLTCALLLLPALSSCVFEDGPDAPQQTDGGYTLNLTLSAGSLAARSGDHATDNGTTAESFIGIAGGDYAVFIFDGEGKYIQRFEPGAVSMERNGTGDDVHYKYVLSGAFRPEKDLDGIQLMVLANWESDFGGSYNDFENVIGDMKLNPSSPASDEDKAKNIYTAENAAFNFKLPTKSTPEGTTSWVPNGSTTGIPMFGLSGTIALNEDREVIEFRGDDEIRMLRSLAKIEILDAVPDKNAEITKCVLTRYSKRGRFIPDGTANTDWNKPVTLVNEPSLPEGATTNDTDLVFGKETYKFKPSESDTEVDKDCFVVYVPEMTLAIAGSDDRPVIEVYLKNAAEPSIIQLADYNGGKEPEREDGKDPYYTNLLRNHSYRYNVTGVGITAEIKLIIDTHWSEHWKEGGEDEWNYEDVRVAFADAAGIFKWGTTKLDHEDVHRHTMIISQDEWLEGSFRLSQPAKGFWTLALISDDDTANDRFRIDTGIRRQLTDESGNPVYDSGNNGEQIPVMTVDWTPGSGSVSGYIDPNPDKNNVLFRIIPIGTNNDVIHYTARVVMTCTTFDGQMIEVNLPYFVETSGNPTGSDNMTPPTVTTSGYYYVKQYYTGFGGYDDDLEEGVAEGGNGDENTGN